MKKILFLGSFISVSSVLLAQSIPGAFTVSQQEIRGTARYMSMAGAFGALGGDLTAITQNPGGIGIYRSNDIGISLGADFNSTDSKSNGYSVSDSHTNFTLNNVGAVFTLNLNNNVLPNLNFGFVYNKTASLNRRFKGIVPNLPTSFSNYIAGVSNYYGLTETDVVTTNYYDPYNPPSNSPYIPWISVLGFDSYLTTPEEIYDPEKDTYYTNWYGQFDDGQGGLKPTKGTGYFDVVEKGSVDNYNIVIGGNINNKFFVGMNFDITSVDYRIESQWGESLTDAYVYNQKSGYTERCDADWTFYDGYRMNGTGFKFNMGFIYKPIQEFRLGFAFHTPTFYTLNETFYDTWIGYDYNFNGQYQSGYAETNDGYPVSNSINLTTPWRIIASAAAVIGTKFIVSAEYEWAGYKKMRYSYSDPYSYFDPWYDYYNPWDDWSIRANNYDFENDKIKEIYRNTNTLKLGAEFRVLSNLSLRAGYSFTSSPVNTKVKDLQVEIPGMGVMSNYTTDNTTNYVTAGLGYKNGGFYADLAYVYKHMTSEYFPYSPDIYNTDLLVKSDLTMKNSSLILTLGYKF